MLAAEAASTPKPLANRIQSMAGSSSENMRSALAPGASPMRRASLKRISSNPVFV